MNICDEDFCLLCYMPGSCCGCEFSDFTWSRSTSQESLCAFDGREKPANFDANELASCTIDGICFLGGAFEHPDLEIDDMIQCPERRPHQPCAASTPKNNDDVEKWESPGAMHPPDSSSPVGLGTDSSPFSTDLALPMSRHEDVIDGRLWFCRPRDGGRLRVKAPFDDRVPATTSMNRFPSRSPTPKLQTREVSSAQTDMGASLRVQGHLADTSESSSFAPGCSVAQGSLGERMRTTRERQAVADGILLNVYDICTTTRTAIEQTRNPEKPDTIDPASACGSLIPACRKGAIFPGPAILDLAISTELESGSSHSTDNDRSRDATTMNSETNGNDGVPSKMPPRRVSIVSVPCLAQATLDSRLKRCRSSVDFDFPPESKKAKLDRVVSYVSCASESSVEFKYQATAPASLRRAQSLRSELSACSEESTVRSWPPCL